MLRRCKRLLSCSTLVCEVTTPSLHSHTLRSARGLLLRLKAIAMNPLPFWLKILETFLFPPSLTPIFRFHEFPLLSFCDEPTGNRSVLETSTVYSVRNTKEVRCQKETPMESHRRKRHRSESSWKSAIIRDLCFVDVRDCCRIFHTSIGQRLAPKSLISRI